MAEPIKPDNDEPITDSQFRLKISRDKLYVYFDDFTPGSGGGKPVSVQNVLAKLKKMDVQYGIDNDNISETLTALESGLLETETDTTQSAVIDADNPLCIVAGDPAIHGENGSLTWKIDETKLNENNYVANTDEVIALLSPSTAGKEGKNVLGKTIRAQPGRDETPKPGEGIEIKQDGDITEYKAKWAGPVTLNNDSLSITNPIHVADDKMSAVIDLYTPSETTQSLTLESVINSLKNFGITHGITEPVLIKSLITLRNNNEPLLGVMAADGTPVLHGTDSSIKWNVDLEHPSPAARVVLAEELIATRKPATTGQDGTDIFGSTSPATPGKGEYNINIGQYIEETPAKNHHEDRAQILGVVEYDTSTEPATLYLDPKITISKDSMEATIDLFSKSASGTDVKATDVVTTLRVNGVEYGIDETGIKQTLKKLSEQPDTEYLEAVVVAKGKQKIDGGETKIIFEQEQITGLEMSGGRIDFHERNYPWNVKKGDLIGNVIKATPKEDGMTVTGVLIEAKEAEEMTLNLTNVSMDITGKLKADIDGALLIDGANLTVAEVLVVNGDVGPKTGNINSDSAVYVKGYVEPSFKLECLSEVIIDKNIEDAVVRAGGGIVIKGGIRGTKSEIYAPSNLNAGFVENATIFVSGDVMIAESSINSEISSDSTITIGSKNAKHSAVKGGTLTAKTKIEAVELGSSAFIKTQVNVGLSQEIRKRTKELKAELEAKQEGITQLNQLEARYNSKPDSQNNDVISKVIATRDAIIAEAEALQTELDKHEIETKKAGNGKIIVSKNTYPGVTICINEHSLEINDLLGPGTFNFDGETVVFHPK